MKNRKTMECSGQQRNDVMISMNCKSKVQFRIAFVTDNDEEEQKIITQADRLADCQDFPAHV